MEHAVITVFTTQYQTQLCKTWVRAGRHATMDLAQDHCDKWLKVDCVTMVRVVETDMTQDEPIIRVAFQRNK